MKPTLDNTYAIQIREDFSLFVAPLGMVRANKPSERDDIDRSHTAEKGYIMSNRAKRKIRSAVYSLYCRATREEQLNLRFVTFTFPPLPKKYDGLDQKAQDDILHKLFKKFIDNERKESNTGINGQPTKLDRYLWVNERQDGERLKGISDARNVLHYHCLFRYTFPVDYWTCNIRWLNLLHRNGFEIFNNAFSAIGYQEQKRQVVEWLESLDYGGLKRAPREIKDTCLACRKGLSNGKYLFTACRL